MLQMTRPEHYQEPKTGISGQTFKPPDIFSHILF